MPEQLDLDLWSVGVQHCAGSGLCCAVAVGFEGAPVGFLDSVEVGGPSAVCFQICLLGEDGALRVDELQVIGDEPVQRFEVTGSHGIQEFVFGGIYCAASIVLGGHIETLAAG